MWLKIVKVILVIFVGLWAIPVKAQVVSFDGWGFTFDSGIADNVTITPYEGDLKCAPVSGHKHSEVI